MLPVNASLSVVDALAPKIATGDYSQTVFYYLGLTTSLAGLTLVISPILAGTQFQVCDIAA